MADDSVKTRVAREPVRVECPICRHRQWLGSVEGRCDQCGSEITLFGSEEEARQTLDALTAEGRLAYLIHPEVDLYAVIANRSFRRPEA